jgi:1,4-dihydroxy-2-naphthoate octaprenyltransferase
VQNKPFDAVNVTLVLTFFLLHFMVYPASNGYNSFMDKDIGSIGGIKLPPPVPQKMFWVTLFLDIVALLLALIFVNLSVAVLILFYILASRAYSYRGIRLKKYPVIAFLLVGVFQGMVVYLITSLSIDRSFRASSMFAVELAVSFLLVTAGYPISQIYQHEQDKKDGVKTISMLLGIRNTFIFSGILFFLNGLLLGLLFVAQKQIDNLIILLVFLSPVLFVFSNWALKAWNKPHLANYENTMLLNKTGAICLNLFFITLILKGVFN